MGATFQSELEQEMSVPQPKKFEIGLVMAGAISAGAYTAGVIDFLLQALAEWEQARKAEDNAIPPHQITIEVMAGSSAGGMTAAIAAAALCSGLNPVTSKPAPDAAIDNRLFSSWVQQVDLAPMLSSEDLAKKDMPVVSLLNSTLLDRIAEQALTFTTNCERPAYISEVLHLLLTVTNLRGVPYVIGLEGDVAVGHGMSMHADYMHFALSDQGMKRPPGATALDRKRANSANWQLLGQAALATGAFPVGLAPRTLSRKLRLLEGAIDDDYAEREWMISVIPKSGETDCRCQGTAKFPPAWPPESLHLDRGPFEYQFLCVDGGLMNNEPLELARRLLKGDDDHNPRDPGQAKRALLMIDPFPNLAPFDPEYTVRDGLLPVILGMFSSLKNQARFKPDEIALALDPNVASRFLIAPKRDNEAFPIASGSLGGFGGFLSYDFRMHDFMLGRRNCQQFLRRHFILPESNPLFADWSSEMKAKYRVDKLGQPHLPIVPLLGRAYEEAPLDRWPGYTQAQLKTMMELIGDRLNNVVRRIIEQTFRRWPLHSLAWFLWGLKKSETRDKIKNIIVADLKKHKLLQ